MEFSAAFEVAFIAGFTVFVIAMLMVDMFVFHRRAHAFSMKEAIGWSVFWIALSLAFNVLLYFWLGKKPALEFLTGYLIEKSLSVDNLFVFLMIFGFFKVPAPYQHRVLFWGIIGALVTRGAMIFVGAALVARFHWVLYVFGVILLWGAVKMALHKDQDIHPDQNPLLRLLRRRLRITPDYEGNRFVVRKDGVLWATPLVAVVAVIESSDVMFAVDSIPAVFAVTTDPLIVFTSNMLAILGLRSLYFVLAGFMARFVHLQAGLSIILAFVAVKILIAGWVEIPTGLSLGVVAAVMTGAIITSILSGRRAS